MHTVSQKSRASDDYIQSHCETYILTLTSYIDIDIWNSKTQSLQTIFFFEDIVSQIEYTKFLKMIKYHDLFIYELIWNLFNYKHVSDMCLNINRYPSNIFTTRYNWIHMKRLSACLYISERLIATLLSILLMFTL